MKSIIEFVLSNELIVMISLFILIIILLIIIIITDKINSKKMTKNAKELLKDNSLGMIDAFKENLDEEYPELTEDLEQYKDVMMFDGDSVSDNTVTEIKYVETNEELEKTQAQLELKRLKEELSKVEYELTENTVKNDITKEKIIEQSETSQEDDAIISIDQFNKISDKKYEENESKQYNDDGNEPISIQELENLYNTKEMKTVTLDTEFNLNKESETVGTKFKSSPVISPVFGINSVDDQTNISLESTANLDKLNEEIRKTNEFLSMLKELKKNLQ